MTDPSHRLSVVAGGLLLALSLPGAASAGDAAYQACCAAAPGGCPTTLQVVGPGTRVSGGQASGLWALSCNVGASHDPLSSAVAAGSLEEGVVVTPIGPRAAACFDAACRLPPDLCVRHDGAGARVVTCSSGELPLPSAWRAPAVDDSSAVVVQGRVVKAMRGPATARFDIERALREAASPSLDLTLPPEPPDPCVPNAAMRDASNQQVDEGNEALIAADPGTALNKYRAAITINSCNAFAWAALGDAMLSSERPLEARKALTVATRIMPAHFQAWTNLGRAAEAAGDPVAARQAYERALEVKADHVPAREALARLR